MKKYEVYLITNRITNKKYIGITTQGIDVRFHKHCIEASTNSPRYLCKALRKYGKEHFTIETIQICKNFTELLKAEQEQIIKYNTFIPAGYNMTAGGEGALGRVQKESTRFKISQARQGIEPWNKGLIGSQVGVWKDKKMSLEARLNMSRAKKGKKLSEETKLKRKYIYEKMKGENHPLYGKGHSEESKRKMSVSKKGQGAKSYKAQNETDSHIFNSLSEVKDFLGIKGHSSLMKAIKLHTIYKGYYWEKLN